MNAFYNRRNQQLWEHTSKQQESWLIGYLLAGDPAKEESLQLLQTACQAGLDVLELGVPSRDPFLDGDVIRRGHQRVMREEKLMPWLVDFLIKARKKVENPIWAMGYYTEIISNGLYRQLAAQRLMDGLLVPDCDEQNLRKIEKEVAPDGIDVIRFVHQEMSEKEMAAVCHDAKMIYAQSYPGTTGRIGAPFEDISHYYQRIRAHTNAFIMLGFGIRSPKMVKQVVASGFQGAVVGSVLVDYVERRQYGNLYRLISQMKRQTIKKEKR